MHSENVEQSSDQLSLALKSCSVKHTISQICSKLSKNIHEMNAFHLKSELAKPLRMHFVSLALISRL